MEPANSFEISMQPWCNYGKVSLLWGYLRCYLKRRMLLGKCRHIWRGTQALSVYCKLFEKLTSVRAFVSKSAIFYRLFWGFESYAKSKEKQKASPRGMGTYWANIRWTGSKNERRYKVLNNTERLQANETWTFISTFCSDIHKSWDCFY